MSNSGSLAETPDFAAPAETNTGSENTNMSANSILTERRSSRSNPSPAASWNIETQSLVLVGGSANEAAAMLDDRSRARKRTDNNRSSGASKSPRRASNASGSNQVPLSAEQRLDQLLAEHRNRTPRWGEQLIGGNLVGSPMESPISPSRATFMRSPPRELTRPLPVHPENVPITDVTSDETGRRATDIGGGQIKR